MKQIAKLSQKLPLVSGTSARGEWKKQSALFCYPNSDTKFMVDFFGGEKIAKLDTCKEGDLVQVDFILTCREYESSIFHDVKGLDIVKLTRDTGNGASVAPSPAAMPPEETAFDK